MIELMLVLWDLKDSRDIVSKLSLMRITSTASLFADFYHTESPSHCLSIISALKINYWFWFTVAHLRMCVAFFPVRLWSRDLDSIQLLFFIFWNQINFKCKLVNVNVITLVMSSHWSMHWQCQLASLTDTCKVHHRLGTEIQCLMLGWLHM